MNNVVYKHTGNTVNDNREVIYSNLLMLIATIFIAISFPVSKNLINFISAEIALLIRFVLAALVFFIIIKIKKIEIFNLKKTWPIYLFVSLFYSLFFFCMFQALYFTTPFNTSVIYTLMPSLTLLISFFMFKGGNIRNIILPLCLAGIASLLVVTDGSFSLLQLINNANIGDAIFMMGTFCMALFINFTKRYSTNDHPIVSTFYMLLGCTFWGVTYLVFNGVEDIQININLYIIVELTFLVLFCTVFTFFALQYSSKYMYPTSASAYSYLTPTVVLLFNVIFLSEDVTKTVIWASIVTAICLIYIQLTAQYRR